MRLARWREERRKKVIKFSRLIVPRPARSSSKRRISGFKFVTTNEKQTLASKKEKRLAMEESVKFLGYYNISLLARFENGILERYLSI